MQKVFKVLNTLLWKRTFEFIYLETTRRPITALALPFDNFMEGHVKIPWSCYRGLDIIMTAE